MGVVLDTSFSLFEVFLLMGITNGFIVSLMIWFSKREEPDKLVLSVALTVFNLLCIKIMLFTSGLWNTSVFRYFPLPFELAIQPLIYIYFKSLTKPGFQLSKKLLLHFIPFFISFIYSLLVYISVFPENDLAQKDAIANRLLFNPVKETEDLLSLVSAVIYWYYCYRMLICYRSWLYNYTSNTLYPTYAWLRNIVFLFALFFVMLTINILLDYGFNYGRENFFHWQILFIYLAALIYYMGMRGYQQPGNLLSVSLPFSPATNETLTINEDLEEINSAEKELTIEPPDVKATEAVAAIIKALTVEKVYLDPELNVQALAKKLKLTSAFVSAVINSEFKKNFRNLVNEYRVEEVKRRLDDAYSSQLSLLGIAYECGFNSEASFYRIFKNIVGLSPKEYLLRKKQA